MNSAPIVSARKIQREYWPRWRPKAAPRLNTSVRRTTSPNTSRGTPRGQRSRTAIHFVTMSERTTVTTTGQKIRDRSASGLSIFFPLLALDAEASMGERVESLERDLFPAVMALSEVLWLLVQATQ